MNRIRNILLWSVLCIYLIIGFSFILRRQYAVVCSSIVINIQDSTRSRFVSKENIEKIIQLKLPKLIGKNLQDINLQEVIAAVKTYPPVAGSDAYKTADGKLVIDIMQRIPLLRIIDKNNDSYYIDQDGFVMRLSGNYTSHVIVANGNIRSDFPINGTTNVLDLEKKTQGKRVIQADLYKLAKYVNNNRFWDAQIQQIFVNFCGEFELIPRVGSNVIIFGDLSNCETKFQNLLGLYRHGFPAVGWNKYDTINLKYKGQVICTKR